MGTEDLARHEFTGGPNTRRDMTHDVLNSIGECIYHWEIDADRLIWSDGAGKLLHVPDGANIQSSEEFNKLLLPAATKSREEIIQLSEAVDQGNGIPYRLHYALSGKKIGTVTDLWLEDTGCWFAGPDGKPVRAHGAVRIINENRSLEERLERISRFDPLTGLFNRAHLNTCLEDIFGRLRQTNGSAAFVLIGLNHFDLINSVYGYEAGDAVMVEVSKRLHENLREVDTLGRFSGARLGIILDDCDERSLLVAGHRIVDSIHSELVKTEQGSVSVSVAIGGVIIPQNASNPRAAFLGAHQALAESRRQKDSCVVSFTPDVERDASQKRSAMMAEKIVTALREGRIHLAFQPIVDATTHEVEFFEALIRLKPQEGESIAAGDFVSVAEKLGLVRLVDHYALDLALQTLLDYPATKLSLNVSNETAVDPEWLSKLAIAATKNPDIIDRLIIEITESHAAESLEEARRFVTSLHDLGFKVALDDFGAGFTSFRNLKTLSFDIIKIDGEFALDLGNNPENSAFISALVDLASLFNAKTVVEWVEDSGSADKLRDWGVDYLQGFKFGKPLQTPEYPIYENSFRKSRA